MRWIWLISTVFAGTAAALLLAGLFAPQRHSMGGRVYSIPAAHDFTIETCGISRWFGCPSDEPADTIWLIFSPRDVARKVAGFQALTRGYVPDVSAHIIVRVQGGAAARNFGNDYSRLWGLYDREILNSSPQSNDGATGWTRTDQLSGLQPTPGKRHYSFFLVPRGGKRGLPSSWTPPSCLSSHDQNGREYFRCQFLLAHQGKTYSFELPEENLKFAGLVPEYVVNRMNEWRRSD